MNCKTFRMTPEKINEYGLFYPHGMGCAQHKNCFTCPNGECIFLNGDPTPDLKCLKYIGMGINGHAVY